MWDENKIAETVKANKMVIFGKGSKSMPMCGFTAKAIDIVGRLGRPFEVINIFDDPSIRPALVNFSKWPTTPQLFLNGEFIGGSDIMEELFDKGELQTKVQAAFGS